MPRFNGRREDAATPVGGHPGRAIRRSVVDHDDVGTPDRTPSISSITRPTVASSLRADDRTRRSPHLTGPTLRPVAELAPAPEPRRTWGPLEIGELRRIAIVPALNEEATVGRVIDEINAFDPGFDIVVVDDGSTDRTAGMAADRGAHVLRLPFNLGIGGAVQTGYRFAFEHGYDIAVQVDGDGQHDPSQLPLILEPVVSGQADLCVGSRFASGSGYQSSFTRRLGIRLFAWVVSAVVRQKVTDTTSGFRAVNRKGIALFAADYPHDYPEVEATIMCVKHKLRLREVPVEMRERGGGESSITALRSIYYMTKVLLAIFVGLFRRYAVPPEEEHRR